MWAPWSAISDATIAARGRLPSGSRRVMNAPAVTASASKPLATLRNATTACRANITTLSRNGTTSSPPGTNWSYQARGTVSPLAVTTMRSTWSPSGIPRRPSPTTTVASAPAASRALRARPASSRSSSTDVTVPVGPTSWASSAAL